MAEPRAAETMRCGFVAVIGAPNSGKSTLTNALVGAGDHLAQYYADKRLSYPPDIEREPGREYRYRV